MKITKQIQLALEAAVRECGGQVSFSQKTGVGQTTLSRYLTGQITDMRLSSLKKLYPHILPFLPPDHLSQLDITSQWELAPSHPVLREHLEQTGKTVQDFTSQFLQNVCQRGSELNLDLQDQLTYELLKCWRDLPLSKRYLLMSYATRLSEEDLPTAEENPEKKVAGS